ncbi:protein kinase [Candidatus Uhrbacteria bacterium]|nr:protein kinase [Candidatus Uhrbacteria bacterium]
MADQENPGITNVIPDHYDLLEVHPQARIEVIEAAFQALLALHPNGARTAQLREAHETLADPKRRRAYDRERTDLVGTVIGSYRVVEQIAEGAIGITYRGEHILTGLPVCVKHCAWLDAETNATLVHEAKLLWGLAHFALPVIHDIIRCADGRIALIMQYVPGPTIAQYVEKHGRIDPPVHVTWIAERILNALWYLHDHDIVHGDLKPQNVILQPKDHLLKIVDFGLAMAKPTAHSENAGYTPRFSPPEQQHLHGPLVSASDFYALGMTMVYALGGMPCVERREIPTHIPAPLRAFIKKLIVLDVRERKFRANVLLEELGRVRVESFGSAHSNMLPLPT